MQVLLYNMNEHYNSYLTIANVTQIPDNECNFMVYSTKTYANLRSYNDYRIVNCT